MTNNNDEEKTNWSFKVEIKTETNPESILEPIAELPKETIKASPPKKIKSVPAETKLVLDTSVLQEKTGFEEFTAQKNLVMKTDEDFARERAELLKMRVLAQLIDFAVIVGLVLLTLIELPIAMKLSNIVLDKIHWKFIFGINITLKLMQFVLFCFNFFIVHVLMLSRTNKTIGKNIMGIKVLGNTEDSISIKVAFMREMIFKPISFLTIIGILYPFIKDEGDPFHDSLSGTQVIVG